MSLESEARSGYSLVLFAAAFALGLLARNYFGRAFSLSLACLGIYFLVLSLNPSIRVLKVADPMRDRFVASSCSLGFLLVGGTVNLFVPAFLEASWTETLILFGVFLFFVASTYVLLQAFSRRFRWGEQFTDIRAVSDFEKRDRYERVTNAMLLTSVFLALDGADLTNVLAMVVAALTWVVSRTALVLGKTQKPGVLNVDDELWQRAFHVMQYRQGLSFLALAFFAGVPLLFYSYSIDLLALDLNQVFGLFVFSFPAVASLLLIRPPGKLSRGARAKLRKWLIPVSFAVPALGVILTPGWLGLLPRVGVQSEAHGVALAWVLASFPFFMGLPLFKSIWHAEVNNFGGFVRWMGVFGLAPFPIVVIMMMLMGDFSATLMVLYCAEALVLTSGVYVLASYVVAMAVRTWERRLSMRLDDFAAILSGPRNAYLLLAATGIGTGLAVALMLLHFSLFFSPLLGGSIIAMVWTAVTVACILPRIDATWSHSGEVAAACLGGAIVVLVLLMWSIGPDVLLVWLRFGRGYLLLFNLGLGSAVGAAAGLVLARGLKSMMKLNGVAKP
jgi:hypothetical protein